MTQEYPITPSPELVKQWWTDFESTEPGIDFLHFIATQAARWGADQQLLACGKYLEQCAAWEEEDVTEMYNYLRPKPPSLKEQALGALYTVAIGTDDTREFTQAIETIKQALESLPE